jgi:hypothetical protein
MEEAKAKTMPTYIIIVVVTFLIVFVIQIIVIFVVFELELECLASEVIDGMGDNLEDKVRLLSCNERPHALFP